MDAKLLNDAINENNIIKIIKLCCERTESQRMEIEQYYQSHFSNSLFGDLSSTARDIEDVFLFNFFTSQAKIDSDMLFDALTENNFRDRTHISLSTFLVEFALTRSNKQLSDIIKIYRKTFSRDPLLQILNKANLVGARFIARLFGGRTEITEEESEKAQKYGVKYVIDLEMVEDDVRNLEQDLFPFEDSHLYRILFQRNSFHLNACFARFFEIHGFSICSSFFRVYERIGQTEMSQVLRFAVSIIRDIPDYFAKKLYNMLELYSAALLNPNTRPIHLETFEHNIFFIIKWRSEIDLIDIAESFTLLCRKSLPYYCRDGIKGPTFINYALLKYFSTM